MWFDWIQRQVCKILIELASPGETKVNVVCRTKDGTEFTPFSIEFRDAPRGKTLILCQNEEDED